MTMTDRDRKIVLIIVPVLLLAAYWFLLLSPQREEASKAADELAQQEERRDDAEAQLEQLKSSRSSFGQDFAKLVKLGKAIPTSVDLPTLIVQLDIAAKGTGISFTKIAAGTPTESAAPAQSGQAGGSGEGGGSGNGAQSAPGKAAENAQNGADGANSSTAEREEAAQKSGADPADTQTSTSSKEGGVPVGGGQTAGQEGQTTGGCAPGLECVPLEFEFRGSFFELADFFHQMKRFVKVANRELEIQGRLLTMDALKFTTDEGSTTALKAEVKATVYLAPKSEGTTAGATPQGPSQTVSSDSGQPSNPTPPTAAVTP